MSSMYTMVTRKTTTQRRTLPPHFLVTVLLLAASGADLSHASKNVLVIFGDSVSDTGNTFRAAGVPDPALYFNGRYTNGPNWVDYLTTRLGVAIKVVNYAHGGALACPEHDNATVTRFPFVKHLADQAAAFQADVGAGKLPAGRGVRLVPLQFIGPNDVRAVLSEALRGNILTPAQTAAFVARVVGCRLAAARAVAGVAGVRDVVLMPMLPMQLVPIVPSFFRPQVTQVVAALDAQLAGAAAALQAQLDAAPAGSPGAGVRLHVLGDYSWIQRGPAAVQPPLTNTTSSCVSPIPPSVLALAPNSSKCANPQDYLFFDAIHFTTRLHRWLALQGVMPRLQQLRLLPYPA